VSSEFFVGNHYETNFDPDTGLQRDIDGLDISDRFSYRASGVDGTFEQQLGVWRWGFDMQFERREYERLDPLANVANYDHEYYDTAASIDRDFGEKMTLSAGLRRYRRVYDELPARDLTGASLSTNAAQEYDYRGVQIGVIRRFSDAIELSADYLRLERIDEFLGYYDYTQAVLRLRAVFRPGSRFMVSVGALVRAYDYPNAFAFNEPTAGPRELDETGGEVLAEFRITRKLSLWAELNATDVTSTDARAAYTRTQTMLGANWRR
jgi:hypothetical protein